MAPVGVFVSQVLRLHNSSCSTMLFTVCLVVQKRVCMYSIYKCTLANTPADAPAVPSCRVHAGVMAVWNACVLLLPHLQIACGTQ